MFEKPQAERVPLSSLPSCLKNPLLLSQFHQGSHGQPCRRGQCPSQALSHFSAGQRSQISAQGSARSQLSRGQRPALPGCLGRDTPAQCRHQTPPHTAGLDVCTMEHRRKPSWGPNFGHCEWEQKEHKEEFGSKILGRKTG